MNNMPGILSSSTKMPLPRTRRSSSLRRSGCPTHFAVALAGAPFEGTRGAAFLFFELLATAFLTIRIIRAF
jgi:hypothetical protein